MEGLSVLSLKEPKDLAAQSGLITLKYNFKVNFLLALNELPTWWMGEKNKRGNSDGKRKSG